MRKIIFKLIAIALLLPITCLGQYEESIDKIHEIYETPKDSIDSLFNGYNHTYYEGVHTYLKSSENKSYSLEYIDSNLIVNYTEWFDKKGYKSMKSAIKNVSNSSGRYRLKKYYLSDEYIYMSSKFRLIDNTMMITVTKR